VNAQSEGARKSPDGKLEARINYNIVIREVGSKAPATRLSTQVVNQLIKHKKDFELLVVPGMGHGSGGEYGQRRNFDFFVRNLQGRMPPARNGDPEPTSPTPTASASARN
jgi:hypothetical protein